MVQIDKGIAQQIIKGHENKAPKDAKIELVRNSPARLEGKMVNAKVEKQLPNGNYQLKTADGDTIEAKITPPPKVGTQIAFIAGKNVEAKITEMVVDKNQQQQGKNQTSADGKNAGTNTNTNTNSNSSVNTNTGTSSSNPQANAGNTTAPKVTDAQLAQTATQVEATAESDPFEALRPLIGKKVAVQALQKLDIPNLKGVMNLVVSKSENGWQTLQPQASAGQSVKPAVQPSTPAPTPTGTAQQSNQTVPTQAASLPPFKAQFPTELPIGTQVKLNINQQSAEVMDITPPKVAQPQATVEAKPTVQMPQNQQNLIIASTKVNLGDIKLPQGSTFTVQTVQASNTVTVQQAVQPVTTEGADLTPTQTPHTNAQGNTAPTSVKTETIQQFNTPALTVGHHKVELTSSIDIPVGTSLQIHVGENGAHVQKIVPTQTHAPQGNAQVLPNTKVDIPLRTPVDAEVINKADNTYTLRLSDGKELQVQSTKNWPVGTQVTLTTFEDGLADILPLKLPQPVAKMVALTKLSSQWQGLMDGLNALKGANPEGASKLQNNIPNLEKGTLLSGMITFIDSVNKQSIERLAGDDTVNLLKALGVDLSADMHNLQSATQKNADSPDSWRSLLFPYIENEGEDPKQGGFFWHQGEDKDGEGKDTRFIVHLDLNAGPVQLEGFMQKRNILLNLKTKEPLTNTQQRELKSIVHTTLDALNLSGDIAFKQSDDKIQKPLSHALEEISQFHVDI